YRVAGLQRALNTLDVLSARHRLPIDRDQDIIFQKPHILGERTRVDLLDQNATFLLEAHRFFARVGEVADLNPELGRSRFRFLALFSPRPLHAKPVAYDVLAVLNLDHEVLLLLVAQNGHLYAVAHGRIGDTVHQIRSVFHGLPINRDNDVFGMDAGLIRGHLRRHFLYEHAFFRAVHGQKLGLHFRELDTDGPACDFARLDDLVVHFRRCVDGQREADALITAGITEDGGVDSDHV